MANNFESNFTRKLMEKVIPSFETQRVLSKSVNTQLFAGKFNGSTGTTIDVQRPTDYVAARTSTGDISASKRDIITGKASATVQDYITVAVDYDEADEALKMGTNMSRFWDDIGNRIVTELEVDFASFMMENAGLLAGDGSTAVGTWLHVAEAGAVMKSTGIPSGNWNYAMNPHTETILADKIVSLGAGGTAGGEVKNALEMATLRQRYAGFDRVMSATALASYTTGTGADRAGTLSANPDVTYVTAKDTMTQVLPVTAFQANLVVAAGEVIKISGRYALNQSTRQPIIDSSGAKVEYTATVAETVTLGASGEGNITITGPAIYEAAGGYNTVDSAPVSGDVVTLLGSADTTYQPNLFWHRDAYVIASVPIKKLHSTDTVATTRDGLQLRVSKYADGDANQQTVRIDLRPAYGVMNPFFAGHGFGS